MSKRSKEQATNLQKQRKLLKLKYKKHSEVRNSAGQLIAVSEI